MPVPKPGLIPALILAASLTGALTHGPGCAGGKQIVKVPGLMIVEPQFEHIHMLQDMIWVKKGGKWGLMNRNGQILMEPQLDDYDRFEEGLAKVSYKEKYGYINKSGRWVIKPQFSNAGRFSEGLAWATIRPGKSGIIGPSPIRGYIDKTGNWVIKPIYDEESTGDFHCGFAYVRLDYRKYVYIDRKGNFLTGPPEGYEYVKNFNSGLAIVKLKGKWGLIDTRGRWVCKPQYDETDFDFENGLLCVKINGKEGVINKQGRMIIKPQFEAINSLYLFKYSLVNAKKPGGKWGFIDRRGRWIIRPQFDDVEPSYDLGQAKVKKGKKWGLVSMQREWNIPPRFDNIRYLTEGLAAVEEDGKWGFVDSKGQWIIKPQFDVLQSFSEGLAFARFFMGKQGFIDKQGDWVITLNLDFKRSHNSLKFFEGLAAVRDDFGGFIDKKGQLIIKHPDWDFYSFDNGIARIGKGYPCRYGFIKNPLPPAEIIKTYRHAGLQVGTVRQVRGGEIIVAGKNIGKKVLLGESLCLYAGKELILLNARFPMMTVVKCDVTSGPAGMIRKGLPVFRYNRPEKEKGKK